MKKYLVAILNFFLVANISLGAVPTRLDSVHVASYLRPSVTGVDLGTSALRWSAYVDLLNTNLGAGASYINGSGDLAVLTSVSSTELGYLDGVSSAIQTQLDGKQAIGNYITGLTGDVTASGPGSVAATIANDAVTNAKSANMTASTIKGRAVGAGTGDPTDLTATQAQAVVGSVPQILAEQSTPSAPSSGYMAVYPKNDGKLYKQTSAGVESEVGSGGAGAFNIATLDTAANSWAVSKQTNADLETSIGDWTAYADAAATTPVDLTGGSPNTTCARTTSSPLNGTGSGLITLSSGASRQGEGCALALNIPTAYRGKLIRVTMPYETTGTIAAGDFVPYAYDVTNSSLLAPSATISGISGSSGQLVTMFQTQTSTAVLRFGLHTARTSTGAATIKFDDAKVEPDFTQANTPVSDWQSYTPTFTGFGTATNVAMWWRRVGDSVEIKGKFDTGTFTATELRLSLPNSIVSDSTKVPAIRAAGVYFRYPGGSTSSHGGPVFVESNVSYITFGNKDVFSSASVSTIAKASGSDFSSGGETWQIDSITVPISGWSSGGGTSPILSLSDWQSYTPTFTGFGTVSAQAFFWRRVGDTLEIAGTFTSGTSTATEARVSIPAGLVSDSSKIPAIRVAGEVAYGNSGGGAQIFALIESAVGYLTFSKALSSHDPHTKIVGNDLASSGEKIWLKASHIPISGWTSTSSGTLTAPRSEVTVDSGNGHGSTATKIRRFSNTRKSIGTAITYADSSTAGATFTINETGVYAISYHDVRSGGAAQLAITVNDSATTTNADAITYAQGLRAGENSGGSAIIGSVSWTGNLTAGDIVRAHTNGSNDDTSANCMFTITKVSN